MPILDDCAGLFTRLRERCPLVHHLTNYVTVNDCANVTLAVGGSPIMATAVEEAGEIAAISSALVLNIGTLDSRTVESMIAAGKSANAKGVPVVFDPVGAGASALRNATTARILDEIAIAVVRGNISEIRAAAGLVSHTKGVDAGEDDLGEGARDAALALARKTGCVVAVTGKQDVVADESRVVVIDNGHAMLSRVSGTGCMCSSLVGSFLGADPARPLTAAVAGVLTMGIAGEIAFARAGELGCGSYRTAIIDAVSLMNGETFRKMGKIDETAH